MTFNVDYNQALIWKDRWACKDLHNAIRYQVERGQVAWFGTLKTLMNKVERENFRALYVHDNIGLTQAGVGAIKVNQSYNPLVCRIVASGPLATSNPPVYGTEVGVNIIETWPDLEMCMIEIVQAVDGCSWEREVQEQLHDILANCPTVAEQIQPEKPEEI